MRRILKALVLLSFGGFVYYLIEYLWRGYSHPAMAVVGGLCFILVGYINNFFGWDMPLYLQIGLGALIITCVELCAGCILNLWLELGIWDYSNLPLNLWGQISVPYMLAWIPMSLLAIVLDDYVRYWVLGEEKPRYVVFCKNKGR